MVRIAIKSLCLAYVLLLSVGCGVKSLPLPSTQVAPPPVADLTAKSMAEGIELSFTVPEADKPDKRVVKVRLYYGYLPITGQPACPPCPPRLRKYHEFDLQGEASQLMEGGKFKYLDTLAPMDKEAFYRVVLKDASGRNSLPSILVSIPRLKPLPPPKGLSVWPENGEVTLAWEGERLTDVDDAKDGLAGWFVFRKILEEDKDKDKDKDKGKGEIKENGTQLNFSPLTKPRLVDRTVVNGKTYYYRVAAVERIKKRLVQGEFTDWKEAKPYDSTAPRPPSELMGASQPQGVYLRFTPSPDQDTAGYFIYRSQDKPGKWVLLNDAPSRGNTYVDTSVKPQTVYFYQVKAVDESGNQSLASETFEIRYLP